MYEDLFTTSAHARAPSEASNDSISAISTPGQGEPIDAPLPAEIVRRCLSDYARPVVQRQTTRVNAPLQRGTNFKIDSHILGLLPTFHGLPSEDPYRHVDEFSQVCEFNQFHNVPSEMAKMRFFPFTLKERAKDYFFTLGSEFDSWRDMEEAFLRKYYSVCKTSTVRRAIHEFSQGPGEVFYEAWERLRDLLRQCTHHGIPKHEITQIFNDGFGAPDRYLLNAASRGTFMSKYEDEALELIELVAENSHHHVAKSFEGRSAPAKGGMLDAKVTETCTLLDKIDKLTEAQNLIMDSLKIQQGFDGLEPVSHVDVSPCSHCSSFEHVELDCPVMAIQGPFPFRPNPTTYPGLSQAGRSNYSNKSYSSFHNPSYAQQRNGQHTPYHQPYRSALQHMGNPRPTSFAPGLPRAVTPPLAVPPLAPSVDHVMSALAQMMSKLNEVSDRLDRVEGAKAQCSDASTEQRKGERVEFIDQLPS